MSAPTVHGLVRSRLRTRSREGQRLRRSIGPAAPTLFSAVPDALHDFSAAESAPWRWQIGTGSDAERYYTVSGERSLADLVLTTPAAVPSWSAALSAVGAALGRLHSVAVAHQGGRADGSHVTPQALDRLANFLHDRRMPPGRPRVLRDRFVEGLGQELLAELIEDCVRAATPSSAVFSHGWSGLGRWYPTPDGGGQGLLGEDLGVAAREHDLGAVLAQVVEVEFFSPRVRTVLTAGQARAALLEGYAVAVEDEWLDREIRLAVTRHVADIFVYADCPDDEPARWATLVGALSPGSVQ